MNSCFVVMYKIYPKNSKWPDCSNIYDIFQHFLYVATSKWKVHCDHGLIFCSGVVDNKGLMYRPFFCLDKSRWSNVGHFNDISSIVNVATDLEGGLRS